MLDPEIHDTQVLTKVFLMILTTVGLGAVFSKQSKKFELLQFVKTLEIYGNRPSH